MKKRLTDGRSMRRLATGTALLALAAITGGAMAQERPAARPSANLYGVTGLIDTPTGEAQPDGMLSFTTSHFGPISRNTLSFQITPRLSASFRFLGIRDWNRNSRNRLGINQFDTYYDRSFDLRFKLLNESRYVPAVTIGLQDFVGTGILSGEYIVATKSLTPGLKVTAGLGWGRLGTKGSIGSPFGARPAFDAGFGGNFNAGQWFRGPAAPFGGIEWAINDNWTLKGEYSSDAYLEEAGRRGTFNYRSPVNVGIEYQRGDAFRVGAYYLYGSQFGVAGTLYLNPTRRPGGNAEQRAPGPIAPRPDRSTNPDAYSGDWITQADAGPILRGNLAKFLAEDGIIVESLGYSEGRAQVRIRNTRLSNNAAAIGRTARVMSQQLPASVEQFEIVPMVDGIATAKVTLRRSDLEALEFDPDAAARIRDRIELSAAGPAFANAVRDPDLYPRFQWSLSPYSRTRFFDQNEPFKIDVGARATARYELSPGLELVGSVTQRIAGNLKDRPPLPRRGNLQPVRSAVYFYDAEGETTVEKLYLKWQGKISDNLYARVSAGYLERMFGGVSAEVLWKPVNSRFALGAEVNYVRQRAPDGKFGFTLPQRLYDTDFGNPGGPSSYSVATGHVSAYYQFDHGFNAQIDVGRYLAGDIGATLSLEREFANGWRVGAFATKTNVSARNFGAGSFDKGIKLEVPFAWVLGKPARTTTKTTLRPFGRDGGQRLDVDGRLYEQVRDYQGQSLNTQFGGFWK